MKIKVLHLTTDSIIAGAERLLLEIGEKYDRSIFDVQFCTLADRGIFHEKMDRMGHKTHALGLKSKKNIFVVFTRLFSLLRIESFDIVHTHLFLSSILGLSAALFARVPFRVMTRHYSDYMYLFGNLLKVKIDRISLRLSDKIIAISNAVAKIIIERDKADPAKVIIIYNGIDVNKFIVKQPDPEHIKKQLGLTDLYIIGAVGSLESRKGHRYLIEAAPLVIKENPKVKFVLVGDGPLMSSLKKQVKKMNLNPHVLFCGYRTDIYRIMSTFDIFVHPSLEEGFGIAILEAMAMGKPIVASAVGGIQEIFQNSNCALLVPPAHSHKLANAITRFLNNKQDPKRLKNEEIRIIRNRFDVRDMVRGYEKMYKDLISSRKKNAAKAT